MTPTHRVAPRPSTSIIHGERGRVVRQPRRHPDELLRRDHALGSLGDLRGDGKWSRRRTRLHRSLEHHARPNLTATSSRCHWTGEPPVSRSARRAASPTRRCRSTRSMAYLYLTEDNFEFPSGFYRYLPPNHPMEAGRLEDGGQLQMLRVKGKPNALLVEAPGQRTPCSTSNGSTSTTRARSSPTHRAKSAPTSNSTAINHVGQPGDRARCGQVLTAGGPGLREGKGVLLLDTGWG